MESVVAVLLAATSRIVVEEEVMMFGNDIIAEAGCCWKARRQTEAMIIDNKWNVLFEKERSC